MAERKLKLLIVDDEAEIREGINRLIPWEKNGVVVAGLAKNGREALRIIAEIEPDIMLLDIRMPVMNGLEVLEKLPDQKHLPQVIILTGYDDFEYCRQALRNGVADYLLKPCRPKEILAVVKKIKLMIMEEERQNSRKAYLQEQLQENTGILRENLLISLISREQIDQEASLSKWRLYEMELEPVNIGVALIRIDHLRKLEDFTREGKLSPKESSLEEIEAPKIAVRNDLTHFLEKPSTFRNFIWAFHDDLLVLWNTDELPDSELITRMEVLRQSIELNHSHPHTVTIGLGEPAENLSQLYSAYNSALLAVEYGFWEGPNRVIRYPKSEEENLAGDNISLQEQNAIIQCIRTNDPEKLEPALEAFFAKLVSHGSKGYILKMITALFCSIYQVCLERGVKTEEVFGRRLAILDELPRLKTLPELKQRIYTCLYQIIEQHPAHKNQRKVVNNALKYMEENYFEELSLERVAQKVYVSAGYLSTIFKQVLRKNFVDSLHEVRVNKAKELLRDVRLRIYEVAIRVGYKDEKYFSQLFKKITGMTPNQYRDTIQ
jgi:two-component system, response regulator YesN